MSISTGYSSIWYLLVLVIWNIPVWECGFSSRALVCQYCMQGELVPRVRSQPEFRIKYTYLVISLSLCPCCINFIYSLALSSSFAPSLSFFFHSLCCVQEHNQWYMGNGYALGNFYILLLVIWIRISIHLGPSGSRNQGGSRVQPTKIFFSGNFVFQVWN